MGNTHSLDPLPFFWPDWIKNTNVVKEWLIPTTETSLHLLRANFEQYRSYLKNNPILISEIESALYWISYLLTTTKFHNSRVISELLYSCSSLLTLFNDNLLRNSYGLENGTNKSVYIFQIILQFIEYIQVFAELAAIQVYGRYGKWIVVSIIEIIKASIRLLLLFYFQQGITRNQYILPLNRKQEFEKYQMNKKFPKKESQSSASSNVDEAIVLNEEFENESLTSINPLQSGIDDQAFQLRSSGRLIRNIEKAPPKEKRIWITPAQTKKLRIFLKKNHINSPSVTQLNRKRLIGELLHILRPLVHLTTGTIVGGFQDKWQPYIVALGLDLVSIQLLKGNCDSTNLLGIVFSPTKTDEDVDEIWNWSERIELQKRYISLFMYLLRSPFYDQYTKQRLIRLLSLFANYIPLFGRLVKPFIAYLPEWQQVYFYVWNI